MVCPYLLCGRQTPTPGPSPIKREGKLNEHKVFCVGGPCSECVYSRRDSTNSIAVSRCSSPTDSDRRQVQAHRPPPMIMQRAQVAGGLRGEERTEAEVHPGYRQVGRGVGCQLPEDAVVTATLVILPGAMQIARSVADGDGALGHMAQAPLNMGDQPLFRRTWA